jgi:hypothetical protein
MSRFAEAAWVPAGTPGGAIDPRVLILHTEATAGDAQPHSGLEWHFMVMNDGRIKQLVDTNRRADANNLANPFAISVETEDDGSPDADPWTPQQVKAIVKLCRWAHEEHGIPLRRCNAWNGSGIGYHTMWGAPSEWTPVAKSCPGAARKAQFESEILPALQPPPPAPSVPQQETLVSFFSVSTGKHYAIAPWGVTALTPEQVWELAVNGAKFVKVSLSTWNALVAGASG